MREPVVAGRFYPAESDELRRTIQNYISNKANSAKTEAIAAIAPHAGYIYSGRLAAETLNSTVIPRTILLLGPNHTGKGSPISLSSESWETPLGEVPINQGLLQAILKSSESAVVNEDAHAFEHSLEVQLPLLQYLQEKLTFVPITLKQLSYTQCVEVADFLEAALKDFAQQLLIVASSDMNHFESRATSEKKDKLALDAIHRMDPHALYSTVQENRISMCGVIPVVITILLSEKLGATSAKIIGYMDSGSVSGDVQQVVGYAGVTIQ